MKPAPPRASTILAQPWLTLARLVWLLLSLAAFWLAVTGIAKSLGEPLTACTPEGAVCAPYVVSREDMAVVKSEGLPEQLFYLIYYAGLILPKIVFSAVGVLIFLRRSNDWIALLFSLMLTLFLLEGITNLDRLQPYADGLYVVNSFIFWLIPFTFPNGRFVPSWMAWTAIPLGILGVGISNSTRLGFQLSENVFAVTLGIPGLVWFAFGTYSSVYRYRFVSSPIERQQTKWVISGILGSFVLFIPLAILSVFYPPSQPSLGRVMFMFIIHTPLYFAGYLAIPAGIAFAVLRYRLWDIDVLIRRTLQYTLLTGVLALAYFGGVVILQGLLGPLTGTRIHRW